MINKRSNQDRNKTDRNKYLSVVECCQTSRWLVVFNIWYRCTPTFTKGHSHWYVHEYCMFPWNSRFRKHPNNLNFPEKHVSLVYPCKSNHTTKGSNSYIPNMKHKFRLHKSIKRTISCFCKDESCLKLCTQNRYHLNS